MLAVVDDRSSWYPPLGRVLEGVAVVVCELVTSGELDVTALLPALCVRGTPAPEVVLL